MAALAGIGAMPDTIEDRAVVIRMRRRAPGESVAPFRHRRDRPALTGLAAQLAGWLGKHLAELEKAEPAMPLEDRAADTWEPLVAVADLAGGLWPGLARDAAVVLTADQDPRRRVSDRIRLLADFRAAFAALGYPEAVTTKDLLKAAELRPRGPMVRHRPQRAHRQAARRPARRLRDPVRHHPVPDRPGQGLPPARLHRRLGAVLPAPGRGTRTIRTILIFPGHPWYGFKPWYGLIRTSKPDPWYGSIRTTDKSVPPLNSQNELGTDGTGTPPNGVTDGGAA